MLSTVLSTGNYMGTGNYTLAEHRMHFYDEIDVLLMVLRVQSVEANEY